MNKYDTLPDPDTIAALALGIVLLPLQTVWHAYVALRLWTWFAVPFGAPVLRLPDAAGVALLVGYLTRQWVNDQRSFRDQLAYGFAMPLAGLLFGTIFALWAGR